MAWLSELEEFIMVLRPKVKAGKQSKQTNKTSKLQIQCWYDSPLSLGFIGNKLKQCEWEKSDGGIQYPKTW